VTIYAGATILGGDTVIGHHSVIGAIAFITESVPCCTTVTNREQPLLMKARSCPDCPRQQKE
jgi:serine O-acetyltransferase